VNHIDWQRRVAFVEATENRGRSRWKGEGGGLGYQLAQSIQHVLASDNTEEYWSRRAQDQIVLTRGQYPWLERENTVALADTDGLLTWWNFAGSSANATLANELAQITTIKVQHDCFGLMFETKATFNQLQSAIGELRERDIEEMKPLIDDRAIEGLKFSQCLPIAFAREMLQARMRDVHAIRSTLTLKLRDLSSQ
jgi:ATP-dependent Lhr-like helicase